MRNLSDIVEATKIGEKPEYDELRYALLAYVAMFNIEHNKLRSVLTREKHPQAICNMELKNSFDMYNNALNKSPKEFLGWSNDPENPGYVERIKAGNRMLDKIFSKLDQRIEEEK